jgi:hypothetical protein
MLKADDYRLQSNRKTKEGKGRLVVSVDTKKKEIVGNYADKGREWRLKGKPAEVKAHDFMDSDPGKAIPYGVYDAKGNEGWVSVGIDHDTAEFAAEALRRWWRGMGKKRYPEAKEILVMADGGGSNGSRSRL